MYSSKILFESGVNNPCGLVYYNGNVYVADTDNNKIKKIDSNNVVTTIEVSGQDATFLRPRGIAIDEDGNIYVADSGNNKIKKIDTTNIVTTIGDTSFNDPQDIAVDEVGNVYVADTNNRVIKKINSDNLVTTIGDTSFVNPCGVEVYNGNVYVADTYNNKIKKIASNNVVTTIGDTSFSLPRSIAVDKNGNIYVADTDNNKIKKIDTTNVVTTIGDTSFSRPNGIALDEDGNIYVADTGNLVIKKINTANVVTSITINIVPLGIAVDKNGNVYVADTFKNKIKKIDLNNLVTTIGDTSFNGPQDIAVDEVGNVYVADTYNNKIKKIDLNNLVTTIEVSGQDTSFFYPHGIAVDKNGNVYVADTYNSKIKKIDSNNVVTTIEVSGQDASFLFPRGIAVDKNGNVYVADTFNNKIKKIDSNNVVTTIGDTSFTYPRGIAVDEDGNVYVADTFNNKIKKINSNNVVTTIGDTSFTYPFGVEVYNKKVYVADTYNSRIIQLLLDPIIIKPNISNYVSGSPPTKDFLLIGNLIPNHQVTSVTYMFYSNTYSSSNLPTLPGYYTATITSVDIGTYTSLYNIIFEQSIIRILPVEITIRPTMNEYFTNSPSNVIFNIVGNLRNETDKIYYRYLYDSNLTPPASIGEHTLSSEVLIVDTNNKIVNTSYNIKYESTKFNVLATPLIPLTIRAIMATHIMGSTLTPDATITGLLLGHKETLTYTYSDMSTPGIKTLSVSAVIKDASDAVVTNMYDITLIPAEFLSKMPVTVKSSMASYAYGETAPTATSTLNGVYSDTLTSTYMYGKSPDKPESVGTYVISETSTIVENGEDATLKRAITYVKSIFRVMPKRATIRPTVNSLIPDVIGLRPGDMIDSIVYKCGNQYTFPTESGSHKVYIKSVVIKNHAQNVVTSNYRLSFYPEILTIP